MKLGGLGEDDGDYRDDEEGDFPPALYPLLSSQVGEDEYELKDGEERHGQEPDLQQKDLEPERLRHQVECMGDGQERGTQQQESKGPCYGYVAVLVAIANKGDEHPTSKEEESDQEGRNHGRASLEVISWLAVFNVSFMDRCRGRASGEIVVIWCFISHKMPPVAIGGREGCTPAKPPGL